MTALTENSSQKIARSDKIFLAFPAQPVIIEDMEA